MIKTFDQFIEQKNDAVEEGLFKKSEMKKIEYFQQSNDLMQKCMEYNLEYVEKAGGEVEVPEDSEFNKVWVWKDRFDANADKNEVVAAYVKSLKVKDDALFMVTKNDEEISLDLEHVDDSTIYIVNSILCDLK